jgi:transcriptional regulator with XRE-family HTH domain
MAGTSDLANPFVGWLAELLQERGLKRQWLIDTASLDSGHLSRVMNRQVDATPEFIIKIARALDLDEVEVLRTAQVIRSASVPPKKEERDEALERYRRATDQLTNQEKELVIGMLEFLAQRLVEARGRHLRKRAMTDAEVDADPAWQQLKEDFESLSPAERDEIIAYGHRLLLEQPKRKKPKSG